MKEFRGCCATGSDRVSGSISPKTQEKKADLRHIMLAGNPNCGKSTLFNRLCNLHVRTGNYPGVTVTRHVGSYGDNIQLIDLPGIYSLSSASTDELVASLELDNKSINTWKMGVERALKKYLPNGTKLSGQTCPNCGQESLVYQEGCLICTNCGTSRCG